MAHHPGQWTTAAAWPGRASPGDSVQAVHMALVRGDTLFARPQSMVLAWSNWGPGKPGGGLWGWRLTTDLPAQAASNLTQITSVATPPYDMFCAGHAALPDGDLLVVSGTERGKTGEKRSARFDAASRMWLSASMNSGRWYGNATVLGRLDLGGGTIAYGRVLATAGNKYDHMVLFGGRHVNGGTLVNDVERYAITNLGHWDPALTDPTPGPGGPPWPDPRESHTLADQIQGPCYLFGGKNAAGTRRDVWQLIRDDTDSKESYQWVELLPGNALDVPSRWRHAAVAATRNIQNPKQDTSAMYVHGGENTEGPLPVTLGDLWKLEWRTDLVPNQWRWTELAVTAADPSHIPTARSGHSAIWDKANQRMILYGGQDDPSGTGTDANVYVLRFPDGVPTWKRATPTTGSRVPYARTRHAMGSDLTTTGSANGIVFGGLTASGLSDSLWEFTVDALDRVTWTPWPPNGPKPAARAGASVILYELTPRSFVLVGGELAGGAVDSTVWEFRRDSNSWTQLPALARALTGHMAFREHRILTELQPEIYNPDNNSWSPFGQTKKRQSYHMIFNTADGQLYSPGPNFAGTDLTWRFAPASGAWTLYPTSTSIILDGTVGGILYRPDQIMKCGGGGIHESQGYANSIQTGLQPPPEQSVPWRPTVNMMARPRVDHSLNMLPTGEVIASGGLQQPGSSDPEFGSPRKRPELWNPTHTDPGQPGKVGYWYGDTLLLPPGQGEQLAAEAVTRGHHSSSVILPDGRILSGGGWDHHPHSVKSTVDQYSPPYLFQPGGALVIRPQLLGAQDHITWTQTFKVACPEVVAAACLIRPGASTHAFNQDVRYVPLEQDPLYPQNGHRVTLRFPAGYGAEHAPPGNYLLFVLRQDAPGRLVPSVARWVNVGATQNPHPTYTTWDIVPPATITNLEVTNVQGTSQTLQWTAPGDAGDGSTNQAKRYELRYRANSAMPTLEDFFIHGRRVDPALLPLPAIGGTTQSVTVTVPGLPPDTVYHFYMISRDGAGSDRNWSALSNAAVTPIGGGCPFVDTRSATGWEVENSILGRSLAGAMALDGYRLRHTPEVRDGRIRLRVRENEQERTTLDQVRLIAVDHAPGVRAYALGEEVVLGSRVPAARVTTSAGADLTALLNGTGEGFRGGPGDTLLVEFAAGEEHSVAGEERGTRSHNPFHIDDGGKCPPDCGDPLRSPADPLSAVAVDAQVLANSGILLQQPDGLGGWRTVLTRYPREHADEAVIEGLGHGPVRMVFVGRHRVRFVGRFESAGGELTARKLPLLVARHSRSGDVVAALDTTGTLVSTLAPGDTVGLEFGWPPVPAGQVRELFFLSHGVYTASLPAALAPVLPERFALHVPRPNPFSGSSTLRFDLPTGTHVRLEVLDAQGRRVRTLANHHLPAGSHAIEWDGRSEKGSRTGPGVYFYRFEAGEFRARGRITRVP